MKREKMKLNFVLYNQSSSKFSKRNSTLGGTLEEFRVSTQLAKASHYIVSLRTRGAESD